MGSVFANHHSAYTTCFSDARRTSQMRYASVTRIPHVCLFVGGFRPAHFCFIVCALSSRSAVFPYRFTIVCRFYFRRIPLFLHPCVACVRLSKGCFSLVSLTFAPLRMALFFCALCFGSLFPAFGAFSCSRSVSLHEPVRSHFDISLILFASALI